jgi:alpha-L-arabinofuranosidase
MKPEKKLSGKIMVTVCMISIAAVGVLLSSCDLLSGGAATISVHPEERFALSPYLYMQFMEPLGTTDGSVDAAWDFNHDRWRPDVIEITRTLAPTMIRWGGCFVSYYKWKEGIGPIRERKPMVNILWGGEYNNHVGTHEFIDFCHQVGAEPLICINFESDGREEWAVSPRGENRVGTAEEAAEWVDYCNNPNNKERIRNGRIEPFKVKYWQIGNETSYGGIFDGETGAKKTLEFARAMRKADPTIEIIAWGQQGWGEKMAEIVGDEIQYLAFHQGYGPGGEDSPLRGPEWRKDWDKTWKYLMKAVEQPKEGLMKMREQTKELGIPLVITEGHFFLPGLNRNDVLSTWAAGVINARIMNMYERNGDVLKIATLADFCGTRWQNNAVMIPTPIHKGPAYMMPVAMVMALYRKHKGEKALDVLASHKDLDVTASRTGDKVFLHVANINRTESVAAFFDIPGYSITSGNIHYIALDPAYEIWEHKPEITAPRTEALPESHAWTFPPASVSVVELIISK